MAEAQRRIDQGDYNQALACCGPLCERIDVTSPEGGELRLLMATAHQGLGQTQQAVVHCRALGQAADPLLRSQARELLMVLEAPALQRPERWRQSLPAIEADPLEWGAGAGRRREDQAQPQQGPPVGTPRVPSAFVLLVALVLLAMLGWMAR